MTQPLIRGLSLYAMMSSSSNFKTQQNSPHVLWLCSMDDEPPPEFYEFTAEDYHRVMASKASAGAKANAGMKTGAMRKADMEAAASHMGPVLIRIHFPDDVIVQVGLSHSCRLH